MFSITAGRSLGYFFRRRQRSPDGSPPSCPGADAWAGRTGSRPGFRLCAGAPCIRSLLRRSPGFWPECAFHADNPPPNLPDAPLPGETKSTRSWTWSTLPAAKIPGRWSDKTHPPPLPSSGDPSLSPPSGTVRFRDQSPRRESGYRRDRFFLFRESAAASGLPRLTSTASAVRRL